MISLKLYTTIINYRLYFTIEEDYDNVLEYAKGIYQKYFSPSCNLFKEIRSLINIELLDSIINNCLLLEKDEAYLELFDDALICCFNYLYKHFEIFIKESDEFQNLYNEITINTAIKEALITVGLIYKY